MTNAIDAADAKRASATQDARDQAAEFDGFAQSEWYVAPNGDKFEVPNIALLDDDQQERFDELQHRLRQCDRPEPTIIPGRTVPERIAREITKDGDGNDVVTEVITPEHVIPERVVPPAPGVYILPYQKDGERITPGYNVQLVQAFLGNEGYAKFKAAGGKSSAYGVMVSRLNNFVDAREGSDSKSAGSVPAVEDVPN